MSNFISLDEGGDLDSIYLQEYELVDRFVGGSLWAIGGYNWYGVLGQGDVVDRSSPVRIGTSTNWNGFMSRSASSSEAYAKQNDGTLWWWGTSHTTPILPTLLANNVFQSASDATINFMVKKDGTLWGVGTNSYGQLGLGHTTNVGVETQVGANTDWKEVAVTGQSFGSTYAIKTDGSLYSWGYNLDGQLGLGDTTNRSSPVRIGSSNNWSSISCVPTSSNFVLALKSDGTLWAWGQNSSGQLGLGDTTARSTPTQVGANTNWKYISSGAGASYGIKKDGTLWSWGLNFAGKLGLGDTTNRSSPVQVGNLTNWKYISYSYGGECVFAIKTDGTLWSCGRNDYGQLGLGDTTYRSSPVQVGTSDKWIAISGKLAIRLETGQ